MDLFPAVDVIPLPAPVWLFKLLHILLLGLHFVAMQLLVGGLLVSTWWVLRYGRAAGSPARAAADQVVRTLPVITTYVINLGVAPLLFAQVLFGHALYSSSIMVGVWWMGIIYLLIALYYLQYVATGRVNDRRPYGNITLFAAAIGLVIPFIFSTVMTLMLRPEYFAEMYQRSASGMLLPEGDPTTWPRWLYMVTGGLTIAGLGIVALGSMQRQSAALRCFMFRQGGGLAAIGMALQGVWLQLVLANQPALVGELLGSSSYAIAKVLWVVLGLGVLGFGAWVWSQSGHLADQTAAAVRRVGWLGSLLGVAQVLSWTALRDGIRDKTMLAKGFDVWGLPVSINASVLVAFFVMLVITLAIVGGLIWLTVTSQPRAEATENE